MVKYKDEKIKYNLIEKLYQLQLCGKYCDYELKTEDGGIFKVHKWVLIEVSKFFDKLINIKDFRESNSNTHLVKEVSSKILEKIIKYMYTGEIEIELNSAKDIVDISLYLNLYTLTSYGVQVLTDNVNDYNCMEFLIYSETCLQYGEKLTKRCVYFICKKFDEFVKSPIYVRLSMETIKLLISQAVKSKIYAEDRYVAVKKWITHDIEEREKFTNALMDDIPLENLNLSFAIPHIFNDHNPLLKQNGLNEKLFKILRKNWEHLQQTPEITKNLYGILGNGLHSYDNEKHEFFEISTELGDNRTNFGHVTFKETNVLICGGELSHGEPLNACKYYSMDTYKWSYLKPMKVPRIRPKLITLSNKIYACCGMDIYSSAFIRSVEIFDMSSEFWSLAEHELRNDRIYNNNLFDVRQLGGSLYFVSGDCVQRCDPKQSTYWKTIYYKDSKNFIFTSFASDNYIYGFGNEYIFTFDIRKCDWLESKIKYKASKDGPPKICLLNDKIYTFFRSDSNSVKDYSLQIRDLSSVRCSNFDCIKHDINLNGEKIEALFSI